MSVYPAASAVPAAPAQARRPAPSGGWTTPRILQAVNVASLIATVLFFLCALNGVWATRNRVKVIGVDTAPSIIAAQKLKVALSDLDANVVNDLIVPPGVSGASLKGYVDRRQEITDNLIKAAENITYGDLEREPIRKITNALSAYERLAIKARTLHDKAEDDDPKKKAAKMAGAISTYRDALKQLSGTLLPAADELAKANENAMDRKDAELEQKVATYSGLTVLTGALLLALLVGTQVFLFSRTNRLINPALLAATVIAAATLIAALSAFGSARSDVKKARDDAFKSLRALWGARATAYDSNSDESRWLFDAERKPELAQAFVDKSNTLVKMPSGSAVDALNAVSATGTLPPDATGLLADEMKNITFEGEKQAAQTMLKTYGEYYKTDSQLRSLENTGDHDGAVRYDLSQKPGDSNYAFAQFDDALGKTIAINQDEFGKAIGRGFAAVKGYEVGLSVAALAIGALSVLGIRARLREYDV